jgi:hypothetical protein
MATGQRRPGKTARRADDAWPRTVAVGDHGKGVRRRAVASGKSLSAQTCFSRQTVDPGAARKIGAAAG